MSGFNGDAWLQFHRGRRLDTIPAASPDEPRYLCPDCGLLMNGQWFVDIHGVTPEEYGQQRVESPLRTTVLDEPDRWADPSDDPTLNREERSIR